MLENIQKGLEQLFDDSFVLAKHFGKKTYADSFKKAYEKHKELFADIIMACEQEEQSEEAIEVLSSVLPAKLERELADMPKRKKEAKIIDYNLTMVAYVMPLITYTKNEMCEKLADKTIEKWNEHTMTLKIGKSDYDQIQGGFRSRLCYITTAVCESLQKPDDCYELNLLRDYRDGYLLSQEDGERIVNEYYNVAPTIVKKINRTGHAEEIYREVWEMYLKPCVQLIQEDKKEECKEIYSDMVRSLQEQHLYS